MTVARYLLICVFMVISGTAEARVRKTALSVDLINLGYFIQFYHDREGEYPKTWDQLTTISPDIDKTLSILKPTQRMALVSPPIDITKRFPRDSGGSVVAISREPFRPKSWRDWPFMSDIEYLEDPSYSALVSVDGGIRLRKFRPDVAKSIFETAGSTLPEPSGLGIYPHEREFMVRRVFNWTVVALLVSWFVWLWLRSRNSKKRTVA